MKTSIFVTKQQNCVFLPLSLRNSVFTGVGSAQDTFVTGIPSSAPQLRENGAKQLVSWQKTKNETPFIAILKRRARGLNVIGLSRNFYRIFSLRPAIQRSNPRVCRSVRLRSARSQRRPVSRFFKRPVYIEGIDRSLWKLLRAFLLQYSVQRAYPHVPSPIRSRAAPELLGGQFC